MVASDSTLAFSALREEARAKYLTIRCINGSGAPKDGTGSASEPPIINSLMVSNALSRLIVYWHGVCIKETRVAYKGSVIA
ncbi:uncharacterized protein G2W53_024969 [Senna tora]|uniref:Uncharacterized protein n=1 Tax=Senna tora TaxID=362788 RepID=A0A834WJU8_9FABA|nr:uncharacterized protein G2W53_024969 [Senna tora]